MFPAALSSEREFSAGRIAAPTDIPELFDTWLSSVGGDQESAAQA